MSAGLNIAVVGACPYPVPQGSQVYLRETALALNRAGHEPRLVVYGYGIGEDTSGLPIHRGLNPPFSRRTKAGPSLSKPLQDWLLARTLRRVCSEHRIDAVCAHNYEGLWVALMAGVRPIVYHAHNAMGDELAHYFGGVKAIARFGAWLDRTLPRRADVVVAPHEHLARYLRALGCERVEVVPPAIDTAAVPRVEERTHHPAVLYTGNLDAYQNLGLLNEAMQMARKASPNIRLRIVTSASLRRTPFANAEWVDLESDEGPEALGSDAVFACPRVSWSGFPIKLLNAMAAEQAIVCCESSAHPFVADRDALVVPDDDAEAFSKAMLKLLHDPRLRERLGTNARKTLETVHDPELFSRRLDAIYRAACPR